jgi:hypothetical protein
MLAGLGGLLIFAHLTGECDTSGRSWAHDQTTGRRSLDTRASGGSRGGVHTRDAGPSVHVSPCRLPRLHTTTAIANLRLPIAIAIAAAMASVFQAFPQLRTAAPRLTRRLFVCRPCLNSSLRPTTRRTAPSVLKSVRWKSTQALRSSATVGPGASLASEAPVKGSASSGSFPGTSSKSVAYWLLGSAASVFGIVVFGGLTRLTESG